MTDTALNLTFHDAPPASTRSGRHPLLDDFEAALKANPGKWALFPEKMGNSNATTLRKKGFEASCRNQTVKGKGDLWACWPATPTSAAKTPPPGRPAATTTEPAKPATPPGRPEGGKVLACNDCDWSTGPTKVGALRTHTLEAHGRAPLAVERTPIAAAA